MPDKNFLESYPLYRKLGCEVPNYFHLFGKPRLNFVCETCDSLQTFGMTNEYPEQKPSGIGTMIGPRVEGAVIKCVYSCASCESDRIYFFLRISENLDWIMKVGQSPAWEITSDKNIERMLRDHKDYLSRGMISESQGYGIGAFAYYRRITEEIIDELLNDLTEIIPDDERENYDIAISKVRGTRQTSEKIDLVKDLLPQSLQVDGMNPLGILHRALSEGLHAESDDECLALAEAVRETLVYLVTEISGRKKSRDVFTSKMRKLLVKKEN